MLRRTFMAGAAALALTGCTADSTPTTIADVIAEVKKQCNFLTEWDQIAKLITTFVSGFNAGAGAATVIASALAKTIVDAICNAVKLQQSQMSVEKKGAPSTLTVVVNGVEITGALSGST